MSEDEFYIGPSEYVGKFPIRQDITVLPDDEPKKAILGWRITEHSGVEIFKPFKGWLKDFRKALSEKECYGDLLQKYAIKSFSGIEVGDTIIAPTFLGLTEAEVVKIDYDEKTGVAESKSSLFYLDFGKDDRNAWVSLSVLSKACLKNIKYSTIKEDKNE